MGFCVQSWILHIRKDITAMLNLVSDAVEELAKDAPSAPIVEYKTKDLIKTLEVFIQPVFQFIS